MPTLLDAVKVIVVSPLSAVYSGIIILVSTDCRVKRKSTDTLSLSNINNVLVLCFDGLFVFSARQRRRQLPLPTSRISAEQGMCRDP